MSKSQKAFTLVEAIVVILVVFVLLSFLLPRFGEPRQSAQRIICSSNMRSIGTGMATYANEFRGMLPPQSYWAGGGWTTTVMYRRDCFKSNAETDEGTVKLLKPFGAGGLYDTGIITDIPMFYCPGVYHVTNDNKVNYFNPDYYMQKKTGEFFIPEKEDYIRSSYCYFKNNIQAIDKMADRSYLYDLIDSWEMIAHWKEPSGGPKGINVLYGDGHVEFKTDAELLKEDNWGATEMEHPSVNAASFFRILKLAGNNSPELKEVEEAYSWTCNEDPFDGARKGNWMFKPNFTTEK